MSEAERKRRQDYKQNRFKWIVIQIVAIALLAIVSVLFFVVYDNMNRTYYINYTESGEAGYRVHNKNYKTDEFLSEEWFDHGNSYISDSVDYIVSDFKYNLRMDANNVGFDYKYSVVANMVITDTTTGKPVYAPVTYLVPEKTVSSHGSNVLICESLTVDYEEFNKTAKEFISSHRLSKASSKLEIRLNVEVLSTCETFEQNGSNSYFKSINIPLNTSTFDIKTSETVSPGENKVLACASSVNKNIFLIIAIVFLVLAILAGGGLVAFTYLTRNEDINYSIKLKKLLSAYRSFIQQIEGEFNTEGYQEICIKSFVELLGIRDTIQSPLLMSENADQTCTKFLIPTSNHLVYVYELKVDNYDELYGSQAAEVSELTFDERVPCVEETVILSSEVDMNEVAEAVAAPDVNLEDIEFVMDDDDDFAVKDDEPGIEVVGVVWPEHAHKNKVYRYDPAGEQLEEGDVVLVPTRDTSKQKDVIRKAAVAHANHRVEPEHIKQPLKKIIGVVKRRLESVLAPNDKK